LSARAQHESETSLGHLDRLFLDCAVMRMEQTAGAAGLEGVEIVARGRLDGLREEHLAESQQQVSERNVRSADLQKAVDRQAGCGPWHLNEGAAERPVIAAQDCPEAKVPFRSDGCGFDGAPVTHWRDQGDDAAMRE
jgi:hypothetical protein